ncbi:peptidase M18, aminopeptidase I [Hesseltinella vesiculosa]|uniref:aspartyl aminopeptidase n=1 Tax=Hesseltinella vesiculosa TaxID=101127 RepID=A0A1X2GCA4_9FUNG|nr:peptidase M18, aminopeptidase I [Hesseltinella vesiculosa]
MTPRHSTSSMSTLSPGTTSLPPSEALGFVEFLNASPSPFHAVQSSVERLELAGFKRLSERGDWHIERKGKYYFTRNGSTVVAFVVGGKYQTGNGYSIVGAHTDSPCLKIKPISKREKAGYLEVGVQLPILHIPTLAIHFDGTAANKFTFNQETQLIPILATAAKDALNATRKGYSDQQDKHHSALIEVLAKELHTFRKAKKKKKKGSRLVDKRTTFFLADQIYDFDLCLFDTQQATIGGIHDEFIFSSRLDNLGMSYCSLMAMINTCDKVEDEPNIRMVALFDNEEVGSTSAQGANSSLLPATLERLVFTEIHDAAASSSVSLSCFPTISRTPGSSTHPKVLFEQAIHKSMLVSADMAHAVHPNYLDKYEENHRPAMHEGTVIKINANQKYATTAPTSLILREIATRRQVPVQEFVVRNDGRCGSTIGAMLSAKMSIRTVDIGNPQLSMHSIRETSGVDDVKHGIDLLEAYFELFPVVESQVCVD